MPPTCLQPELLRRGGWRDLRDGRRTCHRAVMAEYLLGFERVADGHLVERAFDPIVGLGLADLQRLGECGMVDFPLAQRRSGDMEKLGQFRVGRAETTERLDRKSVVSGKSVSVRVDLGGRLIIKKKITINSQTVN